ncbi:MAG: RdgB/HAM1 family non-canonical purine NTP pyrophosphatase [Bacteroidia bacterium]|jgi:XTP/dITP diphosphohydrolase|nr:RdgB/HAM1 family non-canonical purine NTP pyrophosphatase [Bacteroidia bacterium]
MRLLFATQNKHKAFEIEQMLDDSFEVLTLSDLQIDDDIPETGDTLQANALIKAKYLHERLGYNCFADDTGLEVQALHGAPGVHSARYAGNDKNDANNIIKLLQQLSGENNRTARFVTSICLFWNSNMFLFEGELKGKILEQPIGKNGFGYDPVFMPDGYDISLAQMDIELKNKISHRAIAFKKMAEFLKEQTDLI